MRVAITGGAGYIGSHTVVALVEAGHDVVVIDNFCNSSPEVIQRLENLTDRTIEHHAVDVRDTPGLVSCLTESPPDAVVHFAGLKSVGESFERPTDYYDNNVGGTISLLKAMQEWGTRRIIFSSSATVYGHPNELPIPEDHRLAPTNPYGATKQVCERLITWAWSAGKIDAAAFLRYFNPVGAHPSALIGELPRGAPNNLAPYVAQVAAGWRPEVRVFGNDWRTPDGTGVRDYIHVMDLAAGHVLALGLEGTPRAFNLGTGKGTSVLEMITAFERASGRTIPHTFVDRRSGDVDECVADPGRAQERMGWIASRTVDTMAMDAWRWQQTLGERCGE